MDIYSITVDETSGSNEENINAKEAIFELVLDNVIVTYEVIFTETIEHFEVILSDTKVTYIVEPSTTFFTSGIGDAPDEQLYCRRNGQWVSLAPVQSLELGNLHTNAYYGDLGKLAYDHSQATGNPHQLSFSGLSNKPTTVQGYGITNIPAWALSVSKPSYTTSEVTEIDNLYFTYNRVLGTYLEGYIATEGIVNPSDTVLTAIQKLSYRNHNPLTLGSSNGLVLDNQELSLELASTSTTGAISYTDWNTFNEKQPAGSYATLDTNGIVFTTQLPSYVDDVIEVSNYASLPSIGESGKIYVTLDDNKTYRWSGSTWIYITSGAVDSVNGHTGVVILNKSDIGLSNVSNELQWSVSNHPTTTSGYGLPNYPTTLPASDVYPWAKEAVKPSYVWTEISSRPTALSQFSNDLGNYGGWITGINSGMVTTALGYTPWNTSNHPTTLSGYGITDAIQNQQSAAQVGGLWVSQLISTSQGIRIRHDGNANPSFSGYLTFGSSDMSIANSFYLDDLDGLSVNNKVNGKTFSLSKEGNLSALGYYTGTQYKVVGGYSSQFLKGDGSLDSTVYLPSRTFGSAADYNADVNATDDTIVRRSGSGLAMIIGGYLKTTLANVNAVAPVNFFTEAGDGVLRLTSLANTRAFLGLGSSAYTNTNDHILNQNSSAQSANFDILGNGTIRGGLTTFSTSSDLQMLIGNGTRDIYISGATGAGTNKFLQFSNISGNNKLSIYEDKLLINSSGAATFASSVNATQFNASNTISVPSLTSDGYFKLNYGANTNSRVWQIANDGYGYGDFIISQSTTQTSSTFTRKLIINNGNLTIGETPGIGSGSIYATQLQSTIATGTAPLTVNSTTLVVNLNAEYLGGSSRDSFFTNRGTAVGNADNLNILGAYDIINMPSSSNYPIDGGYGSILNFETYYGTQLYFNYDGSRALFRSTNIVTSSWKELYHSGNLTNTLSTNYIPKWNGSSMVNSLISDNNTQIFIGAISSSEYTVTVKGNVGIGAFTDGTAVINAYGATAYFGLNTAENGLRITGPGNVNIPSTTSSTSPTTGALVVSGSIGVGGSGFFGSMLSAKGSGDECFRMTADTAYISGYTANGVTRNGFVQIRSGSIFIQSETGTQNVLLNPYGGNAGIGYNADQGYKLAVNGTGYFNGNIVVSGSITQPLDNTYLAIGNDANIGFTKKAGFSGKMSFANGTSFVISQSSSTNIQAYNTFTDKFTLDGNGNLTVTGSMYASNFVLSSDKTLKTNIQPIIKDYSRLNLVSFNFKDNLDELRFGTIAQDLLSNGFDEFVIGDKEGEYKVKYIDLIIAKLASAENRIKQLEDKLYVSPRY